jgi:hypothetical protein
MTKGFRDGRRTNVFDGPRRREPAGERHLFIFGVDIHNPYTLNDVSAYTTGGQIFRPATDVKKPKS